MTTNALAKLSTSGKIIIHTFRNVHNSTNSHLTNSVIICTILYISGSQLNEV